VGSFVTHSLDRDLIGGRKALRKEKGAGQQRWTRGLVQLAEVDKGHARAAPGEGVPVRAPMRFAHRVRAKVLGIVGWCAPGAVDIAVRTTVASIVIRCAPEGNSEQRWPQAQRHP
jgi:hypothetical protein